MPAPTLKAHYDGERIVLDEPFDLPINSPLMVTVLPVSAADSNTDGIEWSAVAAAGLERAYSDDEPEYSASDVRKLP